jgi:hypothetical protein
MNKEDEVLCAEAIELLPWLLNGTLEAGEAQRVRAHLDSCRSCRNELGETRWAAAVFAAHASAEALVALAWDQPAEGVDLDLVRRHVKNCTACAEELALVRESRGLETSAVPHRLTRPVPFIARYGSLAAALIVAFGSGVLWRSQPRETGPSVSEIERRRLAGRVGELEQEVDRLRQEAAAPEPNVPVVEVLPDSAVQRSPTSAETRLVLPRGARFVALVLSSDRAAGPVSVELRDAAGETAWKGSDLTPGPLGGYTLGLPAALLAEGKYTVVLRPARGKPETYSIVVAYAP